MLESISVLPISSFVLRLFELCGNLTFESLEIFATSSYFVGVYHCLFNREHNILAEGSSLEHPPSKGNYGNLKEDHSESTVTGAEYDNYNL